MLTTERNLWIERTVWQYWQLIRVLFFNFKVVGYLSLFFFSLAGMFYCLGFISPFFKIMSVCIAPLALFILLFVGVIILPISILSLLANKHIYTMDNIRNKLFIIVLGFCLFFSITMPLALHGLKNEEFSFNAFFSVFMLGALYFGFALYLGHKKLYLFGVVPLILGGVTKIASDYLLVLPSMGLAIASAISWGVFYLWWYKFRPTNAIAKSILVETNHKKLQELPIEKWLYLSSLSANQIKTPIGSLLLGYGDGTLALLRKLLFINLFTLVFTSFICGAVKDWHFTENTFSAVLIALTYSFLIFGIDLLSQRFFLGVKRCWLVFPGNRIAFFCYLERYFLRSLGFLISINAAIICVFLWVSGKPNYFFYCFGGLVVLSLMLIENFYLNLYFFSSGQLITNEINWKKTLVNLVFFVPTIIYLISKYSQFNTFELKDGIAIGLLLLFVVLLKVGRAKCINQWQKAEF